MSAAHTVGPWKTEKNNAGLHVVGANSLVVCFLKNCDRDHRESNASLIAAAPEMLAKLEKVVAWLDRLADRSEQDAKDTRFVSLAQAHADDARNYRATADSIRPVIAKATGSAA